MVHVRNEGGNVTSRQILFLLMHNIHFQNLSEVQG
jgi:hypothetical protein